MIAHRSFVNRLALRYARATLAVVLLITLGAVVSRIADFEYHWRSSIGEARRDATTLMVGQLRAGRSLTQAGQYTWEHLGRRYFSIYVVKLQPYSEAFNPYNSAPRPLQSAAQLMVSIDQLIGFATVQQRRVYIPGGVLYVNVNYMTLAEDVSYTLLRLLPFAAVALVLAYGIGRRLGASALSPVSDATKMLQEFAGGDFTPVRIAGDATEETRAMTAAYNEATAQAQKAIEDRELAAANVRTFIADASHELKTPLTIAMGYLGAILEGVVTDSADERRVLQKTMVECRRMRSTIEKLIALARLDRDPAAAVPFDVVALLRDVVESLRGLTSLLHVQISDGDEVIALGNDAELREAIICIIDNAVKYAPGSPIDVQVKTAADVVVLEIADAGPGMSEEDRLHAFERFRRGSSHAGVEGSGLGLAIAQRAVQRANGRIALSSELGRGTTVRLYIPRVPANGSPAQVLREDAPPAAIQA